MGVELELALRFRRFRMNVSHILHFCVSHGSWGLSLNFFRSDGTISASSISVPLPKEKS